MADFPEISEVLRLLGIGGNYSGHRLTAAAVILTIKDPDRLLYVTNHLYWPVAQQHGCSWQCVERAIRSAAKRAWERNPDYLKELARYPMEKRPQPQNLWIFWPATSCAEMCSPRVRADLE